MRVIDAYEMMKKSYEVYKNNPIEAKSLLQEAYSILDSLYTLVAPYVFKDLSIQVAGDGEGRREWLAVQRRGKRRAEK